MTIGNIIKTNTKNIENIRFLTIGSLLNKIFFSPLLTAE